MPELRNWGTDYAALARDALVVGRGLLVGLVLYWWLLPALIETGAAR